MDLAAEVLGGEPSLAELVGQRVGRGGQVHPGLGQLAEQPGHQHGVAGIVELEFVDGQQPVPGQPPDGLVEPERADQVGVFDERAVRLGPRHACQSEASRWVLPTPKPPSR